MFRVVIVEVNKITTLHYNNLLLILRPTREVKNRIQTKTCLVMRILHLFTHTDVGNNYSLEVDDVSLHAAMRGTV